MYFKNFFLILVLSQEVPPAGEKTMVVKQFEDQKNPGYSLRVNRETLKSLPLWYQAECEVLEKSGKVEIVESTCGGK
jgi:hypothetical protein